MGWFAAVSILLCVCAIAAAVIAREAVRSSRTPEPPVVVLDEAYHYIADRLPPEVAATLTPNDLRMLLNDAVEVLGAEGLDLSPEAEVEGHDEDSTRDPYVLGADSLAAALRTRAGERGEAMIPEQVEPVASLLLQYFLEVGITGVPVEDASE